MRKIGGINMNTTILLKGKKNNRDCSIYESLKESVKEVKLFKNGNKELNTWDVFFNELNKEK